MTKFIVVKKNSLILIFMFLLLILALLFSIYNRKEIKQMPVILSTAIKDGDLVSSDLNGDGSNEILEVIVEKEKYIIKIKNDNKNYILKTQEDSNILGDASPNWPMRVTLQDLSRNGIPEIIIQTSIDSKPINYIFTWRNGNYINLYSNTNNLIGILDSSNSKTPKLLTLSSNEGDNSTNSLLISEKKLKDISFSKITVPGLSTLQAFIDIIETSYELDVMPDIFNYSIDSTELSLLWKLDKETYNYSFQNGYFYDISLDNNNETTTLNWCLSFEQLNKKDDKSLKKELLLLVNISKDTYGNYKITAISKQ